MTRRRPRNGLIAFNNITARVTLRYHQSLDLCSWNLRGGTYGGIEQTATDTVECPCVNHQGETESDRNVHQHRDANSSVRRCSQICNPHPRKSKKSGFEISETVVDLISSRIWRERNVQKEKSAYEFTHHRHDIWKA